ncbi:MAG: trehalase family glycosidase [SAR324 cluster bacterium]|jgi:alpha,alpha-trehalase|nr:neutral trehalase [Pseudomonadota bacterium]MBP44240.1 neutral trehalase [Deltaproteobacteria bacterium]MDP6091431.1 trehalase family glycosidase [SAR324 cluster bacterium]MDP6248188.1 trehalase family glycosidase [SAR324 cluster bacterium]MDP6463944.1 trehalase family glycosidase [SAR324 cluster bacterium]|tara:strand:- start:1628 stop:2941 length:1314 start_codon:yes stop_codon:yes gene_type:complete
MIQTGLNNPDKFVKSARSILEQNDRGGYTVPTDRLYPYQWNWDSSICALGWQQLDEARAWQEIRMLLKGQWADGMLPHIVFHQDSPDYFPNADVWNVPEECFPKGVAHPPTSGISQPPVLATCIRKLWEGKQKSTIGTGELRQICQQVLAWHRWYWSARDPKNRGLVSILHPWESGMDNSPAWDEALSRVPSTQNSSYTRQDTSLIDSRQRPLQKEYDRYLYLVEKLRDQVYDSLKINDGFPFRVIDIGLNSILQRANLDLLALLDQFGMKSECLELEGRIQLTHYAIGNLWDQKLEGFFSLDEITDEPIQVSTSACFLPLFAGLATNEQAAKIGSILENWSEQGFHLVPSTSPFHPKYESQRYWRGPVWPHVNWMICEGLKNYGQDALAQKIREQTMDLISKLGFHEYYHPHGKSGFGGASFSWTAAVYLIWSNDA